MADSPETRQREPWSWARAHSADSSVKTDDHQTRRVNLAFLILALGLGLLQTWDTRYGMNADGISYLDMGDAYVHGDWAMAINASWSPLYSWLLGVAEAIIRPSPYWEYPLAHLVTFATYVFSLCCFVFFLQELIRYHHRHTSGLPEHGDTPLPEWALLVLGYTLFIWSSLTLITLRIVTPDMSVAAFVYLTSAVLVRIRGGSRTWRVFFALGLVLGLGYLTKTPMFPLGFVFLGVSVFLVGNLRSGASRVLTALLVFLLLSAPFIVALSSSKGRLTFGDSGKLNYAWFVSGVGRHWQGGPSKGDVPRHATREILDTPKVFEFGTPVGGTYPYWYDPSYWYEGVANTFDVTEHVKNMVRKLRWYYHLALFALHGSLVFGVFALYYMGGTRRQVRHCLGTQWYLLVPAAAAFLMYMQVHVEERYIASFLTLLLLAAFFGVRLPNSPGYGKIVSATVIVIVTMAIISLGPSALRSAYGVSRDWREVRTESVSWQVAEELKTMGLREGYRVGSLGNANRGNAMWARLARARIVAEISSHEDVESFWSSSCVLRERVVQAFVYTGADVVVADKVPRGADICGWQAVGGTGYYAYFLSGNRDSRPR